MATLELKKKIIEKLEDTEDDKILEEVYRILAIEKDGAVYKLSEQQRNMLAEADEDIQNSRLTSHDDAKKEMDEWLTK